MRTSFILTVAALAVSALVPTSTAEAQDTAAAGALRGTVVSATQPRVADVAICVPSIGRCEISDSRGEFAITDLRADEYALEVAAPGRPTLPLMVTVRAGLDSVIEIVLPEAQSLEEKITVVAPKFVTADELKTSGYLISAADIGRSAGALQDVSRYVQSLPGAVIGTDDFRNDLIVRGGSPLENLYIVDNVEIPNINTFATFASAGGTVGMLDSVLLQDVTFLTGGYPAAFGNRTSSVLQVSLREGDRTRTGGRVTFGFAGLGAVAEGRLGASRGSWVVSFRRSVLDWVTEDTGIGGVPVLYTFNGKVTYDFSPRDRVWLLNVSGVDRIRLGLTEDSELNDELSNLDIRYRGRRYASGLNWQRTFGSRGIGLFGVTYSRAATDQRIKDLLKNGLPASGLSVEEQLARGTEVFREDSTETEFGAKYDLTLNVGWAGKVQAGVSARRLATNYDAASPYGSDGPYFATPDQNPFALRQQDTTSLGAAYLQVSRSVGPRVGVTLGGRVDRFGYLAAWRAAPRVGLRYQLTPTVSVKASGGRYYQQPFTLFVSAFPENRDLRPFRADHAVAGLEWVPSEVTRFSIEAYDKRYAEYPVSLDVPSLSLANIGDTFAIRDVLFPLESRGTGYSRGVEVLAERKATATSKWYGQANVAVSRTRHAGLDEVLRPGSFDYPVVANLIGSYRFNSRWDAGTRVSYLAGRPFTPTDMAASTAGRRQVYDLNRVNDARSPDYFRVDLRVDRRFTVNGQPVSLFIGAQNVTSRKNVSGYSWDRRNNAPRVLDQLGLFPILGLDWTF
jgi:TonB dependent receptor/TonB-dependent Receptor Plug Domain